MMGFFKKKKKENQDDYLEELVISDFDEEKAGIEPEPMRSLTLEEKKMTIENCLDRITSTSSRIRDLKVEYQAVISYLTDIQLIEELPEEKKHTLLNSAKKVVVLDRDRRDFGKTMSKITDSQFHHIMEYEEELPDILKKMSEDEKYLESVKMDMRYLEAEKSGYRYDISHMKNKLYLLNGMAKIGMIAFMVLMIVFLIVNYSLGKDTSMFIYGLIGVTAVTAAVLYLEHMDAVRELEEASVRQNKVIGLLNKTKIRYVNGVGSLSYAYEKHGVKSSYQLNKIWGAYLTQKKKHEVYNRASARLIDAEEDMLAILKSSGVKDTSVWVNQVYSLVDRSELDEMKQHLLKRRDKLKTSLDYNMDVEEKAREEIKNIIVGDKEHAEELVKILDEYEEKL